MLTFTINNTNYLIRKLHLGDYDRWVRYIMTIEYSSSLFIEKKCSFELFYEIVNNNNYCIISNHNIIATFCIIKYLLPNFKTTLFYKGDEIIPEIQVYVNILIESQKEICSKL